MTNQTIVLIAMILPLIDAWRWCRAERQRRHTRRCVQRQLAQVERQRAWDANPPKWA
jgi:hypothetical protein